jgi:hypothetical protein
MRCKRLLPLQDLICIPNWSYSCKYEPVLGAGNIDEWELRGARQPYLVFRLQRDVFQPCDDVPAARGRPTRYVGTADGAPHSFIDPSRADDARRG